MPLSPRSWDKKGKEQRKRENLLNPLAGWPISGNLSDSHCLTHIASDLAARALASHAKPRRVLIASILHRSILNTCRSFTLRANITGFPAETFVAFSCEFRTSFGGFASLAKQKTFFASRNLGVCDSNRVAHHSGIVRFRPLTANHLPRPVGVNRFKTLLR